MTVVTEQFNGNVYIVIPAYVANKKLKNQLEKESYSKEGGDELIQEMSRRIESEISSHLHQSLQRYSLGSQKLACFDELECCTGDGLYETIDIIATVDSNTQLAVVMLVLHDKHFMVSQLLDRVSADNLILKTGQQQCCGLNEYLLNRFGIQLLSSAAKTCLSTRQPIPTDILPSYLASETYNSENMDAQIISPEVAEQTSLNIAQYNSSDIYAGKKSVLRVDRRPGDHQVATLASDSVFLFVLEILAFKEAAVLRTNTKTIEAISDSRLLEMSTMDQLTSEFSTTMPFWDIRVFRYITAQNLANKLDNSFGIEKHFVTYDKNQQFLEHKINIRQAIRQGNEDKILFFIALILFVFEIAPYLFTMYQRLLDHKWFSMSEIYSILGSGVSTWALVLLIVSIIKRRKRHHGS
ncbi:hypothetical protein DI392_15765 [Vibrio albus]|uniref:Uncharacterized protein n=1 Tax=Vibrio albus TaxID=2200953 RepID=A0A2U3B6T0_9VIBR|nr:hypothetical protein [Vibrio albus]PWI32503.1 hypothetical protein DI392_15765 [Vibrio albus]